MASRSWWAVRASKLTAALLAIRLVALALPAVEAGEAVLVVPPSPGSVNAVVPLDGAMPEGAATWQLAELGSDLAVPAQVVPALSPEGLKGNRRLAVAIPPAAGERARRFAIRPGPAPAEGSGFRLEDLDDKSLKLWDGDAPLLVYNHGPITAEHVPESDPRRTRSCYLHPLWGLNGEVLTADFPRDHYHHHGIFWTWPHVGIEGQEYDLWADRGIRQQFVAWLARETGPVAGVIGVENGWFVGDRKVMVERVWIRAYRAVGESRGLDLEFVWIPTDRPVTLWGASGKSYGGLTVRFAPPSAKDPATTITVPSGPTTGDLPDTPLAWADFTSRFGDFAERSGAAVFVHPEHPDFPPTWLTRHYGPLCIGWPGVDPKTFEPGEVIRLDYRVWIHKGSVETAQIEQAYEAYAQGEAIAWE